MPMKFSPSFTRGMRQLNLPVTFLIALLQRTPVLKLAIATEEFVLSSPLGAVLKSALATAASLGAVHTLAGATELAPSKSSPASATVGTPFTVAFDITGTISSADWWTVSGAIPPGLTFDGGVTSGRVNVALLVLSGTPTTPGSYTFTLVAGDPAGGDSPPFSYTVMVSGPAVSAPSFTTQPQSETVTVGANVTFTSAASGSPTYQWRKNGNSITGATSASLSLTNVQVTDAGTYTVVATNAGGSTTSAAATLTVNALPAVEFTTQPQSQAVSVGANVTLSVVATGSPTFQWQKDGVDIAGATSATLMLSNVQKADTGTYAVVATKGQAFTSDIAIVHVGERSYLSNLSVRATLSAQQNLIVGFVVSGGAKPILIRAGGPALNSTFGVTGYLPDPQLTLYGSNGSIQATNQDWPDTLAASFERLGAFPFVSGSKDAALEESVSGPATAHAPAGSAGGLQLVEVYDAGTAGGAALANVSARNHVGTGDNILIAGFVIEGSNKKHVLIRGVGPGLNFQFGLTGILNNPKVTLYTSDGAVIASNDNWSSSLTSTFARLGGFDLENGSQDAALVVALEPGVYTAQVAGADGGTGEALVEIYDADP